MKTQLFFLRVLLLLSALVFLLVDVNSQSFGVCGYVDDTYTPSAPTSGCESSSQAWLDKYRTPGFWIPDENMPLKTILVNWIVCKDDNGENGWQDTPEFHEQVDLMFSHINEWYSNSQPKGYTLTCEPTYTHIYDTRIRFELNDIIFLDNTTFNESCSADDILEYVYDNYPGSENVFSHVFTQPLNQCYSSAWGYYSLTGSGNNAYVQTWYSMWSDWIVVWADHIAHITHEYGHAVGLHHTYNGEQRCITNYDFLDDVFGLCAEPTCEPCSTPGNCNDGHVCFLTAECFYQYQDQPYFLMSGFNNSRYISPKAAGRMHRALSLYDNRFMINNKPMNKYVKEDHSFNIPLSITEDEVWDFSIKMYQDIVVEEGNTLNIKCEVKMPIDGKIIVKPGGRLVVDGGHITSAHSQPWQGIQVWGDKTAHQYIYSNSGNYNQGYLELRNGATIENAIVAVDLWKPDDYSTTGGIVHAIGGNTEETRVVFRNNAKSIHALHYNNYNPVNTSQELDYNSYFKYCTFEITQDFPADETFYKHIDLAHVKGIDFYACDFSVDDQVEGVSTWNSAIAGYDAKFGVKAICNSSQFPCPENSYDKCTFTGFYSAVSALNDGGSTVSFSLYRTDFTDNTYGVKAREMNNASVLQSDFKIGHLWDCGAGIYSDNITGFAFENNDFSKYTGSPNSDYFGIIINNSEAVNEVVGNDFEGLSYANFSDGKNWINDNRYEGLAYYCNDNVNNYADFYVNDYELDKHSGIQSEQGNDNYSAGTLVSNKIFIS